MKSSSAGALAREALNPVRKSSRPGMLRLRRILLPKVRAEAPVHGRFATSSIRSGGARPPIRLQIRRAMAFSRQQAEN